MRNFKRFWKVIVLAVILVTGCKKDFKTDGNVASLAENSLSKKSTLLSEALKKKLANIHTTLPAGYEKRLELNSSFLLKTHPEYREMVSRALKITPTPCDDNTALFKWLSNELADWDDDVIFYALATGMLNFPTYDALFFENSSDGQYFGLDGEYSQSVTKAFKDLQRFWNIQSQDIVLAAMHGNMLLNRDKVIRIDMILYNDTEPVAEYWADLILYLLDQVPQYRRGDHPIFTFNAYAVGGFPFPPFGDVPDKIIMGDGIMDGYAGIGFNDVAPQAIIAHEFGHHIQYQLGLFTDEVSPEATRRTELMADAYSAYFLSHARGASMQWKRVKQFLEVFFNICDCAFTDNNHHGTPTQRMAAAEWAYSVANNAQKQGQILTAEEFTALFEAQLPELITH